MFLITKKGLNILIFKDYLNKYWCNTSVKTVKRYTEKQRRQKKNKHFKHQSDFSKIEAKIANKTVLGGK